MTERSREIEAQRPAPTETMLEQQEKLRRQHERDVAETERLHAEMRAERRGRDHPERLTAEAGLVRMVSPTAEDARTGGMVPVIESVVRGSAAETPARQYHYATLAALQDLVARVRELEQEVRRLRGAVVEGVELGTRPHSALEAALPAASLEGGT